ncbi:hypothetical protein BDZ94DRAFT_785978 [Collybia nuda]|uniref:F-box domain-containing protein n=1 Tax=Collybia nuda TaxID=64659 RepID=A0A9P6CNM7_9AGAR|nr:hypothetical protein BDZ94DRAFT_785978 [Collybia nuda]
MRAHPQERVHRCLLIPELFNFICIQIDETLGFKRFSTLAALARTCRLFRDAPLDILWSRIPDLGRLIRCMPSDVWTITRGELQIVRPICASDCPRFFEYSRRVKSIGTSYNMYNDPRLELNFYEKLDGIEKPLLPNVTRIVWCHVPPRRFSECDWILGPNINDIELSLSLPSAPLSYDHDYMMAFHSKYPLLKRFCINVFGDYTSASGMVSTLVCGWASLDTLEIRGVSDVLAHISALPNLRVLKYFETRDTQITTSPIFSLLAFQSLQVLLLIANNLSLGVNVIRSLRNGSLRKIQFHIRNNQPFAVWGDFFAAIGAHCRPSSLTSIRVDEEYYRTPVIEPILHPITMEVLRPLLAFSNLTEVIIIHRLRFDIDAQAIKDIASSWPRLRVLELHHSGCALHSGLPPRLTLCALTPLVERCRELASLAIDTDASGPLPVLNPQTISAIGNRGCGNCRFSVGHSPISDSTSVATFLRQLFPNGVKIVTTSPGRCVQVDNLWLGVADLLAPKE